MNTLTIYKRTILERTGFKKYPYKEVEQISIFYNGKEIKNHDEKIDNPRLKVKFEKIFESRNEKEFESFINIKGWSKTTMFIRNALYEVLKDECK